MSTPAPYRTSSPPPKKAPAPDSDVVVIGHESAVWRDLYHAVLRATWPRTLLGITVVFLALNALFAVAYLEMGGIAHARSGSFLDAFFFSVQTMGTIGYGGMYPETRGANFLVVAEAVVSLVVTAMATGLVFAKFSRSAARVAFTREIVISPMNGVPTLMFRVSNQRGNYVVEAQVRVTLIRTERTSEGKMFYRMVDVNLTRDRSSAFSRGWTLLHPIVAGSPLFGASPESLHAEEAEIVVTLSGLDETSMQPLHARKTYGEHEILWGARHRDVLSELPDGRMQLDLRNFHEVEPSEPTADFPYPAAHAPR